VLRLHLSRLVASVLWPRVEEGVGTLSRVLLVPRTGIGVAVAVVMRRA
jgi:hypothetical protein